MAAWQTLTILCTTGSNRAAVLHWAQLLPNTSLSSKTSSVPSESSEAFFSPTQCPPTSRLSSSYPSPNTSNGSTSPMTLPISPLTDLSPSPNVSTQHLAIKLLHPPPLISVLTYHNKLLACTPLQPLGFPPNLHLLHCHPPLPAIPFIPPTTLLHPLQISTTTPSFSHLPQAGIFMHWSFLVFASFLSKTLVSDVMVVGAMLKLEQKYVVWARTVKVVERVGIAKATCSWYSQSKMGRWNCQSNGMGVGYDWCFNREMLWGWSNWEVMQVELLF